MRFIGNRSSGRMGFALAERAAAPRRRGHGGRRQRGAPARARRRLRRRRDRRRAARRPARGRSPPATSCSWPPPSPTSGRPSAARTRSRRTRAGADARCSSSSARDDVLAGLAAARRPEQMLIGFAAETGAGRAGLRPRQARSASGSTPSWSTTWPRRASASTRPTTRSRSSPRRASGTCRGPPRREVARRHPRRGLEPAFIHREYLRGAYGADRAPARVRRRRRGARPRAPSRGGSRRTSGAPSRSATRCIDHVIVALLAEGHILVEDYPGVGKTALARALARSVDCQFARVQCTADLLPADIVGTNVFNQREGRFEFRPGPIFANVVLVDEINRASPKTQSGLLECMQERHVTVDVALPRARLAVPRLRHAEPGRVRGHLPAARGAGRPLHGAALARLPRRRRRRRTCSPATRAATACSSSSRSSTAPRCSPPRTPPAACTPRARCATTSSRCCATRARTRASSSAPRRAPA